MQYPKFLKTGDTIGVTATSSGFTDEIDRIKLENAQKNLEAIGYHIVETENVRTNEKLVSSSGEERAKEFYELYSNENVNHIIAASGGEFLMEMIPYLDKYHLQEKNPKWVQGFSDTSLLLFYLTTKYDIATVHSVNYGGYGRKEIHPAFQKTLEMISSGEDKVQHSFEMYESFPINWQEGKELEMPRLDTKVEYKNLYEGTVEKMQGRLIGGCIDVLKTLVGTPYDNTKKFCKKYPEGTVWYLENCEMSVCDLYRALWQMREAGWFENARGFLIGRTMKQDTIHGYSYQDALHDALDSLKVPVIYDVDVGHTQLQWTMINGSFAEFEYENGKGKMMTRLC